MFCPKCGASIGIDFGKTRPDDPLYGISVRMAEPESALELTVCRFDSSTILI